MTIRRFHLAVLLAFLLFGLTSAIITFWGLQAQRHDALVINLAGRQRMLIQHMRAEALNIQATGRLTHREALRKIAYTYFEEALNALVAGGEVPYGDTTVALPPTRDPQIRAQLETVRATWKEMQPAIDSVLVEGRHSTAFAEGVATVERLAPVLLAQMDEAVQMYEAAAEGKLARVQAIQLGFLVVIAVLPAGAYLVIYQQILRPISRLRATARQIGAGELPASVAVTGVRELEGLARDFDSMYQKLVAAQRELERWAGTLDARVAARTRELTALSAVAGAANRHIEIGALLDEVLPLLTDVTNASAAWVTLLDGDENFVLAGAHNLPLALEADDCAALRWSGCTCQRKLLAGELTGAANILNCDRWQRTQGNASNPRYHAAVPICVRRRVLGHLNLMRSPERLFSDDERRLLNAAGDQLGVAIERVREHQALKEAETRYRNLFDGVPVGLYRTTPEGQILDANRALVDMLGYPDRASLLTVNAADLYVNPEVRKQVYALKKRDGLVRDFEMQLRRRDGTIIWARDNSRAVRDADGQVLYSEGSLEDITERKQAEETIHRRAEEMTALYNTSLEIGALADPSAEPVLGLSKEQALSKGPGRSLTSLLWTICNRAARLLGVAKGGLYLYDETQNELEPVVAYRLKSNSTGTCLKPGEGVAGRILQTGQPLIVDDYSHWEGRARVYAEEPFAAVIGVPLKWQEQVIGVITLSEETARRTFSADDERLLSLFAQQAAIAIENVRLYHELEEAYVETVLALANAMDARDAYTADHSYRMATWAVTAARELGCSEEEIQATRWGAYLHDIGKIGVPDRILRKPGKLSKEEWAIIKRHPEVGAEIVAPVKKLADVAPIIRAHHEHWSGAGYPDGLRGEEIPLAARVLSVIDAYSAITDERPYKAARSHEEALAELQRCAGTQFDPQAVEAFLHVVETEDLHPVRSNDSQR